MPLNYYESSSSSESSDSNFEVQNVRKSKTPRNTNFEKNYPKNILISILTSLDLTHQHKIYHDLGISADEIQKRNSASLKDIHNILTHPEMKSINNPSSYEILASKILLQNSKISKKAFHLETLRDIFSLGNEISFENFKLEMKEKAKKNSSKEASNIQIFKYQSTTIFLLTMFCKAIENNPIQNEDSTENKDTADEQNNLSLNREDLQKNSKKSNRQLLKPLIHLLSTKLNRRRWGKENVDHIMTSIREMISQTEEQMYEILKLSKGVSSMRLFVDQVVCKCFNSIKQRRRITFSDLQKLVKKFENESLNTVLRKNCGFTGLTEESYFKPQQHKKQYKNSKSVQRCNAFSPIILTAPS